MIYHVSARRRDGLRHSAGYIVETDSEGEALDLVNSKLPANWRAEAAEPIPAEREADFRAQFSPLIMRPTRH